MSPLFPCQFVFEITLSACALYEGAEHNWQKTCDFTDAGFRDGGGDWSCAPSTYLFFAISKTKKGPRFFDFLRKKSRKKNLGKNSRKFDNLIMIDRKIFSRLRRDFDYFHVVTLQNA